MKNGLAGMGIAAVLLALLDLLVWAFEPAAPWKIPLPATKAGTYRIFAFGGSTVEGIPQPALGFVAQLEAALRRAEPTRPLEVVNFGAGGQASSYARSALEYGVEAGPDLMVVLTAHNEFLDRSGEAGRAQSTVRQITDTFALTRLLRSGLVRLRNAAESRQNIMPDRLVPYDRSSPWFRNKMERFRSNLRKMVELSQKHRIPLILMTGPSNLADWPPVHHQISWVKDQSYDTDIRELQRLIEAGDLSAALTRVEHLLHRYGDDAMMLYLKGSIFRKLHRNADAHALFVRARDLDPYPWRATSEINDIIRSFSGFDHVHVIDVAAAFEAEAEGGLVGFELVSDNVHPTPIGNAIVSNEILRSMEGRGYFLGPQSTLPSPQQSLEWFLLGLGSRRQDLELQRLLNNAVYCAKTPFYNYQAARGSLNQAASIDPGRWEIWANLGVLDLLENRVEEGRAELRRAARLRGAPLDPEDRRHVPYLKEAMARSATAPESIAP